MIDIHCHILQGIDDGASDIEESVKMCKKSEKLGISGIVVTPHMIPGETHQITETLVQSKIKLLKDALVQNEIKIDIYSGAEILISPNLPELLKEGKLLTINNTNYVLIEFPFDSIPLYAEDVLCRLQLEGYMPIIAHPERNREISKNIDIVEKYVQNGAYLQINLSSLRGIYGKRVKKAAKKLIKGNFAHFIASDSHNIRSKSLGLADVKKLTQNLIGKDALRTLISDNPRDILLGKSISAGEPIKPKRKLLKVVAVLMILLAVIIPIGLYSANKIFNTVFEYMILDSLVSEPYNALGDQKPFQERSNANKDVVVSSSSGADNEINDKTDGKQSINKNDTSNGQTSRERSNNVQPDVQNNTQKNTSSGPLISADKIKKIEESVSVADKSKTISIVAKSLSSSQFSEIRGMIAGGITSAEKSRIEQMLKSSVKKENKSELKAIYNKYANLLNNN